MSATVYVPCPRIVTKSYTRTNAWGFEEDCEPEDACGWEVEVVVADGNATIQGDECDGCEGTWNASERKMIRDAASQTAAVHA